MNLTYRALLANRNDEDASARHRVDTWIERAKVGSRLAKKLLGADTSWWEWLPVNEWGQQVTCTIDGVTLHTWREFGTFGGATDVLRYGETTIRSLSHLGRLIEKRNPCVPTCSIIYTT